MAETADVQRLIALVEANTKAYERSMNRLVGVTNQAMTKASREISKVNTALNAAGAAATRFVRGFAVGALTAGIGGFAAMAKNAVATAAALQDVAANTGIAASELQKLALAAEQSGGNAESLLSSIKKFNVEIGQARSRGGELADILKANGISLEQDNLAIWRQVVDLIANAKDEIDAAHIAQVAMGRSAADNLAFYRQGSAEISRIGEAAAAAGAIVDDALIKKADEFMDRWNLAWQTITAQVTGWAIKAIAAIESVLEAIEQSEVYKFMHRNEPLTAGQMTQGVGSTIDILRAAAPARTPTIIPPQGANKTKDLDEIPLKVQNVTAELEKLKSWQDIVKDGFDNMGASLLDVARGTEKLGDVIKRMLDNILDQLANQAFQQLIGAAFGAAFPTPRLTGAQARQTLAFGGPRQGGGHVSRGKGYVVGERGPELLVPSRSGYVVPNKGMGGGGGVQVHVHAPPGTTADTQRSRSGSGERIDVMIRNAVRQEIPGAMRPVMRDQYGITPASRKRF